MPKPDGFIPDDVRKEFSDLLNQRNKNSHAIHSIFLNPGPILMPDVFERQFQEREAILKRLKHLQENYPDLTDDNPDTYGVHVESILFMCRHHRALSAAARGAEIGSKFGGIIGKFVRSVFPRRKRTRKKED